MSRRILSLSDVQGLARVAAEQIRWLDDVSAPTVYAIPRGGISAAFAISAYAVFRLVDNPCEADYIVDDLIDSGHTMERTLLAASVTAFGAIPRKPPIPVVLIDKREPEWAGEWIVFPWEGDAIGSMEDNVRRMLQFIGEDTNRGGLHETPARVTKAWSFWCKGYAEDPATILKVFEDGAENVDEMVMVRDIPFYTHCEHHMAPFFGKATVAYIPDGKIVGLSKINRLVDCFARRLQVQERLTTQIADSIMEHLTPKGVGVRIEARHLCMESRGVCQQGHSTITSALRGRMVDGVVRQEFLALAK